MTDDGRAKTIINVPEDFFNQKHFQSGKTQVSFLASRTGQPILDFNSDIVSQHDVIGMTSGSGMLITDISSSSTTKSSFSRNSSFSLAVIRVSDKYNHSPDDALAQISDNIFGTSGAPFNLVRGTIFDF